MNVEELKKRYAALEKKHKLPSFSELNEEFEIESIRKGGELLLRTIRKAMMNKVVNSLGFVENLLNPVNSPRMYYAYLKSMGSDDKKELDKMYSVLSDLVLGSLKLEIDYSEKEEVDMINKTMKDWKSVKPSFRKIIVNMQKPAAPNGVKEKSYFG